jgi:ring-1,2-phenylacetyl-CoA epoxidase subunit PaaD
MLLPFCPLNYLRLFVLQVFNLISMESIDQVLDTVSDPEIPVLSIRDLGILRHAQQLPDGTVEVTITPTYSGCPAMGMIEVNVKAALQEAGYDKVVVKTVLHPAWTTDWLSPEGRAKLEAFGIAPPASASMDKKALLGETRILRCPNCGSDHTQMIAQFASTSCKALFKCLDCLEPFDYFKCH